jgi:hypothetical protein
MFVHFYNSFVCILRQGFVSLLVCSERSLPFGHAISAGCSVLLGPPILLSSLEAAGCSQQASLLEPRPNISPPMQDYHRVTFFTHNFFDHGLLYEKLLLLSL